MKLHQSLAELARDHGTALFRDAAAFRGSLDDYLDEGQASSGTINLLTDAVRLGALDGLVSMLDSGATPADAVQSAGQRLARDRGSADVRGCQWALAVLGYALGKVPDSLVAGLDPDAGTTAPPSYGPAGTAPTQIPGQSPVQSPVQSPISSPPPPPVAPGQRPMMQPMVSPPQQPPPPYPGPVQGWSQPAPRKSKTGLIVAAVAVALVLIVAGIVGIIAIAGSDDDRRADDPSTSAATTDGTDGTDGPTDGPTDAESSAPDLGGPVVDGTGYQAALPEGWVDGTDEFTSQNPGLTTLDRVFIWGSTFNTARGNVIVETQSSYGSSDPADLAEDWKTALTSDDDTASTVDIDDTTIAGQRAIGVDINRTNDSGVDVAQRSYLVINEDTAYSITVSLKDGDDDVLDRFDEILGSWQWTS